jgi:uncharacterized protein
MIRATIDTNILASGIIARKSSLPLQIYQALLSEQVTLVTAQELLTELEDVLNRDYMVKMHRLSKEVIHEIVAIITQFSAVIPVENVSPISPDPDDDILFACALVGQADYIVSGDKKHVLKLGNYQSIPIITARRFVELIDQDE